MNKNNEDKFARLQEIEKLFKHNVKASLPGWQPVRNEDVEFLLTELREAWTHQRNDEEGIMVEKLRAELAEKTEALKFYAEADYGNHPSQYNSDRENYPIIAEKGRRASTVLAKWDRTTKEK